MKFFLQVDFASGALLLLGQLRTGANVFVVLYSSCTAFTAVFSHFLMGKRLVLQQWAAVLLVSAGIESHHNIYSQYAIYLVRIAISVAIQRQC